ncbi:cysteine desulfurase family protein [Roseinatronobacter sp. S2]|uniref:cysteine desulfurase family protein n=1 Tax=Roseinatronobacter sp. S2 TaxID=3035471 RepID=UPI00240F8A1C|nr:aminotransferase class V-fold PLP-dependent enzyme [Roseinatronobacter sp. S2]WFE75242.1 aminotransferase class V-fold PLP-dependent enzyme [Roseinatronobacter sp. S2]
MQVGETIYLDYQASTPSDPRVLKVMAEASATLFANPHAADHALGWRAAAALDIAASQVGNLFGLQGDDVIFTSGASEANAMVIRTAQAIAGRSGKTEILIGAGDHGSIIKEAEACGLVSRFIALDDSGAPDPAHLKNLLSDATALVSIVGVNNENGAIADLATIAELCRSNGTLFHADLAQAPIALDLDLLDLDIALVTISAHKLYGPKGVGALLTGPGSSGLVRPVIAGAGQQGGRRGGTMPTELIVGFGEACRILQSVGQSERESLATIRGLFVRCLEEKQVATLVGSLENRHPGNALMRFPGRNASDLLARLQPRIAASTQSACSSGSIEPSHVLTAMGFDREMASECIRFSFGRFSTEQQAAMAVQFLSEALAST